MRGLLPDNEPPPRFTFSSLLALLAAAATLGLELWAMVSWQVAPSLEAFAAVFYLPVAVLVTLALCGIAIYLRPARWGLIGIAAVLAPVVVYPVVLLVLEALRRTGLG